MKRWICFIAIIFSYYLGYTQPVDRNWSGNSPSWDDISQPSNWYGGVNPNPDDNLFFNSTITRHEPYCDYGSGDARFGWIITYDGAGGIKWRGGYETSAYKFENQSDPNTFEIECNIANRTGSDIEMNPVGTGGINILAVCTFTIESGRLAKIYGSNTLTVNGIIAGAGGFALQNVASPVVIFNNANTYTGHTYVSGGSLKLNYAFGNSIPATNNVTIDGGTLQVSENQTISNLTLSSGSLLIDAGKTLTINGSYTSTGGTIINNGTIVFNSNNNFPGASTAVTACNNLTNNAGITMNNSFTITGNLTLNSGTFSINGNTLILSGASLSYTSGVMSGSLSSHLIVQGATGGTVTIPLSSNISLFTLTIGGSRTVAMNGINNLNLYGPFSIASGCTYDNGGESQIIDGGTPYTPTINISGKYITRDAEGFTGTLSSIPGLNPTLNLGCTIEYGRAGDQLISIRSDYRNLIFSGGGIKSLAVASPITPIIGTVTIPDATIVDVANNTFGDGTGANQTNFTMSGPGRFRTSSTSTNPQMLGTYSLTNGTVEFYNSSITAQTIRNKTYFNIEVTGSNVANGPGLITLADGGNFTVKTGGVFSINDDAIVGPVGTQTVAIETGGTFKCGDVDGFSEAPLETSTSVRGNIENIIINSGSTVEYTRSGNQALTSRTDYANLTISGSNIKIANGVVTLSGNLNLIAAIMEDNGNTITITNGNITGNSTHSGTGKILMTGSSATISGATLGNLELNNAGGFSLTGSPTITNTLTFTNGKLSLGNNDITMLNTTTPFLGYNENKFILTNGNGVIKQSINSAAIGSYYFPMGGTISGTDYSNIFEIEWTVAAGITQLSTRFIPTPLASPTSLTSIAYGYLSPELDVPTPITEFLNNGYWEINSTGSGTPSDYRILFTPNGFSNLGDLAQQHTIFKNTSTDPATWTFSGDATNLWPDYFAGGDFDPTPTSSISIFQVENTSVSGFSNYGIGRSENAYVLPIVLTHFNATLINSDVWLSWNTSSEVNNNYFEIQRSMDGGSWNAIGQVEGAGSTSVPQHYSFIDHDVPGMILYYRLKQVDYNGDIEYSEIRVVNNLGNEPYIVYGYYNIAGQKLESLEHAPSGIYLQVSNKGSFKVLHTAE